MNISYENAYFKIDEYFMYVDRNLDSLDYGDITTPRDVNYRFRELYLNRYLYKERAISKYKCPEDDIVLVGTFIPYSARSTYEN